MGTLTNWAITGYNITTLAIKTDGSLWSWGGNLNGGNGLGESGRRSSPVQVGSLTNWKDLKIINGTQAIKTDGTLWAWGLNSSAQLGLGDVVSRSSPVQVGTLTNWKRIVSRSYLEFMCVSDGLEE